MEISIVESKITAGHFWVDVDEKSIALFIGSEALSHAMEYVEFKNKQLKDLADGLDT